MKKKIALIGASGSIGKQTLDILRQHPDEFELSAVSVGSSQDFVEELLDEFDTIKTIGITELKRPLEKEGVTVFEGDSQLEKTAEAADYDVLVNAVVGFRGLRPSLKAIERDKILALANKESLVCGGDLVLDALKNHPKASLVPIDSEHSAIFQCLQGNDPADVERLIITASGGSFRDRSRDELKNVTREQALNHPNWKMGKRITLDSATMVNKGFEVIEAHYLFNVPYSRIETVLHPESIVHSMVEYRDHAVMAQLGSADMRLPIQYALMYPARPFFEEKSPLDMTKTLDLHFKEMDFQRFPMLKLAYECGKKGQGYPCAFNAADEAAVELFLNDQISFVQIEECISKALENTEPLETMSLEALVDLDLKTRAFVKNLVL